MLLNLWHSFIKWFMCEKAAKPIFMQLVAVWLAQKTTL
jgi:hypothetical protein